MRVKTVIVDDEQPICDEIEYLLKKHIELDIVAKFTNSIEALEYIIENRPGLVFLDIKMPGLSGLEIAERLSMEHYPPLIVFLTAFGEHALAAFNTPAVGYIAKPVTETKLNAVMKKIRNIFLSIDAQMSTRSDKICVLFEKKIIPLDRQEIVLAYVKDKAVYIRTKKNEGISTLTLQELENCIMDTNFLRVHRQYLVNLDKVLEIIPWFHGSYLLRMDDCKQQEVPVSRNKIKTLKMIMGLK